MCSPLLPARLSPPPADPSPIPLLFLSLYSPGVRCVLLTYIHTLSRPFSSSCLSGNIPGAGGTERALRPLRCDIRSLVSLEEWTWTLSQWGRRSGHSGFSSSPDISAEPLLIQTRAVPPESPLDTPVLNLSQNPRLCVRKPLSANAGSSLGLTVHFCSIETGPHSPYAGLELITQLTMTLNS